MSPNLRAALLLLLVFVAGGVAGAAFERTHDARPRRNSAGADHAVEAERIPLPLEALGLSNDETRQLHAIARRWRPRAADLVRGLSANVGELENNMFAEMLCVITPDQRRRYLASLERNHADSTLIDRRFRLVHANQCADSVGSTSGGP
jgi:hypothetical protein